MAKKNARYVDFAFHATTTPGHYIVVGVGYGESWASFKSWKGYYLTATPEKVSVSKTGLLCTSFMCFSGKRLVVEPAERFSAKRLAAIAANAASLPEYAPTVEALAAANGLTLTGEVLTKKEAWEKAPLES